MPKNSERTQAKQEWLAQRLKNFNQKQSRFEITQHARPANLPLSFAQQRLWFLEQWEPGSTAYLLPTAWRLRGLLDRAALENSLTALVIRHESLRTVFTVVDENPVQIIASASSVSLPLRDLTSLTEEGREAEVTRCLQEESTRPFDLATGPLWRGQLLHLGFEEHVFLLTFHHIITDGWSMGIVFKELSALYTTHITGQPSTLPPLRIQYADYAVWQRQWLQGMELDRQLNYWRTQLAETPSGLDLPTNFPRPPRQTYRGNRLFFTLPASLTQALKVLSRQEGVTLFMTLLAAFQILLARYSGQRDILVGVPIAGRTQADLEGLIGFFVNTLVLRARIMGQPTFRDILQQTRTTCLNAYSHQDLPFEKLVEILQPVRDPSRHPLFQVMFQLFNKPHLAFSLSGLQITPHPFTHQTAKFDLNLTCQEIDDSLRGTLEYSSDLFAVSTMHRLIEHYQQLLKGSVATPDRRVDTLNFLSDDERHQLLVEWNPPGSPDPPSLCMHHLFEEQVTRTPETVAIVHEEESLTYEALNARAHQVAHYLIRQGIGPEVRVGVYAERSIAMMVGLLGILKAGGAYVPLDPAAPPDRLRFMLENAEVALVLTSAVLQARLAAQVGHFDTSGGPGPPLVVLDREWPELARDHIPSASLPAVHADNLVYVIYTSGSTGQPKGVAIQHRSAVSLVQWAQEQFLPAELAGMLASTSICFDLSVFELFVPLSCGGTVHLAENALALPTLPTAFHVTLINSVPSAVGELLRQQGVPPSVRVVNLAGEPLKHALVKQLYAVPGLDKVYDLYGPTETTTYSTVALRSPTGPDTIGKPVTNEQIYLLDETRNLVPVGVAGELCIGGFGLARGYFRQPAMTAEKFIPHPFSRLAGARLYRSGDLARHRDEGTLEFLGRRDHQVKIRGYRIECGEIETILRTHSAVQETVLLCREDSPGKKQLVAYVVLTSESSVEPGELRSFLKTQLPDYMVPGVFVKLDTLPLTSNGKVNRQALPAPETAHRSFAVPAVPPRTPVEELLVEIWQDLLKVKNIGVHDNFFELGGHSLLATQVIARIRTLMQTDLSVRTLFDNPTIGQLGALLQTTRWQSTAFAIPPLQSQEHDGPRPLSFAQQRLWFLDQWEPGSTAYLLPYAWRLRGPLDRTLLEASLATMVARHEILRTTFSVINDQPMQIIAPATRISLTHHDLTYLPETRREDEVRRFVQEETLQPFDLSLGPLWRVQLLRLGPADHVFLFTLHHIITDGWSMGIVFQELSMLYTAQVTGQSEKLPPLPLQYADFALWQRQWMQGDVLEGQLTYWRTQLADAPPFLALPTDAPRPPQSSHRGERLVFAFPASLTQALKILSHHEGVTLFMTLLAAFQILLARYAGQRDILVGTPIAGRTHTDLEGLIGFFVNTLVLRTQFKGQPTFRDVLRQVRETCLAAYAQQDLPFEKLVETLHPVRDPSRHPLFQVMFQLHHANSTAELTLPHLEVVPLDSVSPTAKFDLSLSLVMKGETLQGSIIFNTDLFEPATIRRLATHYHTFLEGAAANPGHTVSQLPLVTDAERQQLLVEWNPVVGQPLASLCVHHLFEEQVTRTPEAVAVVHEEESLTYEALNARAYQVAHYLIRQGIGPEVRVGVYVERSIAMVVGLLGILKAGGAYVPLDPAAPPDRLRFMLEDAEVALVLTSAALQAQLAAQLGHFETPGGQGRPIVALDREWPPLARENNVPSSLPAVHPENLVYVMYTSGSTGQPKGVAIPHRGVVRLVKHPTYLPWPPQAVFLQLASPAFDAATFEIWGCLVQGGTLVLGPSLLPSLDDLGGLLQRHQISILWLTAGLFHQMVDWNLKALRPVQSLLAGGDVLSPRHVRRLAEQLPTCQLINGYGPTENTTFTCCFLIPPAGDFGDSVPLGHPIAHTQVYALDAQQHLVPRGIAGELCIGGLGLARGYHRQPAMTAEKFIPHPFSPVAGARLYRSGDLARHRDEGTLEFLGRRDHQVKIRGYRIELGEIEVVLSAHPAVREVAVMPREDSAGNKRLVGYIVLESGAVPQISEFRDCLTRSLPAYMIPAKFVFLDAFPLTSNGKIDRSHLPVEDQSSFQEKTLYVPPRNSLESQLTKIWELVLGKKPIGITDNFFTLGGESLMAVRLCSEMERALQKKIPVPLIFHAQTIEQLAKKIGQGEEAQSPSLMVPIQPTGSNPPIYCFGFGSNFRQYLKDYPNQPLYMFLNQGHDGRPVLNTTVEKIAALCLREIRTVQSKGPYHLAGYSFGGIVVYEMAQQLRKQGETTGLLALVDPTTSRPKPASIPRRTQLNQLLKSSRHEEEKRLFPFKILPIAHTIFIKAVEAVHWRWNKLQSTSWKKIRLMLCKIYFRFGYPLPTYLRRFYRDIVVRKAASQYTPQQYSGQIVVFQTQNFVETYWSTLCSEVVEVYNLPCKHHDIYLEGPHAPSLLHQLLNHLEKAKKIQT